MSPPPPEPRWPERVIELCRELVPRPIRSDTLQRDEAKSALWILLHDALSRSLERQAARLGRSGLADLEDLAAGKALELLLSVESGKWDVSGRSGAEVAAFVTTVARNALIDGHRRRRREVSWPKFDAEIGQEIEPVGPDFWNGGSTANSAPGDRLAAEEFVGALAQCLQSLAPRSRWAWFLRVFHDMPTKLIATHPAVGLNPGHVDVLLQRCRRSIRTCMEQRGHETDQLPAGTFITLWETLRRSSDLPPPGGADSTVKATMAGAIDETL